MFGSMLRSFTCVYGQCWAARPRTADQRGHAASCWGVVPALGSHQTAGLPRGSVTSARGAGSGGGGSAARGRCHCLGAVSTVAVGSGPFPGRGCPGALALAGGGGGGQIVPGAGLCTRLKVPLPAADVPIWAVPCPRQPMQRWAVWEARRPPCAAQDGRPRCGALAATTTARFLPASG